MKRKIAVVTVLLVLVVAGLLVWLAIRVERRVVGQYFDSKGVRIHFTDEGAGEPVILIHGFAANADLNWRVPGITQGLAEDYRVIALDNRGHGLSDKPHDVDAYGMMMVDDVIRLMDHLKIEKAHIVGYSMGGFIALKFLTTYPERAICAAPCGAGWELPVDSGDFSDTLAGSLEENGDFSPLFTMLDPEGQGLGPVATWLSNRKLNAENDVLALAAAIRSLDAIAVPEEALRANTVPTLTVVGTDDPLRAGVDRMTGVMSNHQVIHIEGANHLTALGPELLRHVKDFIAAHPATGEAIPDAA
ncbi:MAG: alpha/beta hydrolase [Candidatus Hydrogenedentota bacterium]